MKIHAIQLSTLHDPLKLYIFSEREIGFNSLSSVLEKCGKMNITVAIAIVKQIAKVLSFLHASNFAHKSKSLKMRSVAVTQFITLGLSIENVYINDISHVKVGWYWCWKLIQGIFEFLITPD
jgi:serine/threonine protein kinase